MAKKTNEKKYKHLTPEDRRQIEECLGKRMTFKSIGKLLQKDPTTISYEIKHHRKARFTDTFIRGTILLKGIADLNKNR